MIKRMIKAHPTDYRMPRQATHSWAAQQRPAQPRAGAAVEPVTGRKTARTSPPPVLSAAAQLARDPAEDGCGSGG
jgi:hypothetical protein